MIETHNFHLEYKIIFIAKNIRCCMFLFLPSTFWSYFIESIIGFTLLRFLCTMMLNNPIKKRAILITVLLGIFHSIVSGIVAFYMIITHDYSAHYFLSGFSFAYFLCDILQMLFLCESSSNNRISIIHHVCGMTCIAMSLLFPVIVPIDLGIYVVVSELTMPGINVQWIIDTYWENQKHTRWYKLLAIYNLGVYLIYRIFVTYYGFWQMINRKFYIQSICTLPFVIFNTVWFSMLVRKFRGSGKDVL